MFDSFNSPNAMALILSLVIFAVTSSLIVYRLVPFIITVALLFFWLASGFAIANNEIINTYLGTYITEKDKAAIDSLDEPESIAAAKQKISAIFMEVVNTLSNKKSDPSPPKP